MLERDLQDYLFQNPDILFPGQEVKEKRRECSIQGRRVDLLFHVDGIQYIVELKRHTIRRQDIGQIIEYYGLMRQATKGAEFRMILAAPSIPTYRRVFLEEIGIRCVEVQHTPLSVGEEATLREASSEQVKRERAERKSFNIPEDLPTIRLEDILPPASPTSVGIAHLIIEDTAPAIEEYFPDYEVRPFKIVNPQSPDVFCFPAASGLGGHFVRGGIWWAFSFGHLENMPKNDVPNISVCALPWGLDFAINAELRTSQEVMLRRISSRTEDFDRLTAEHGTLELQAWLKLEHQPRFYHWIPLLQQSPGAWKGRDILDAYQGLELDFSRVREKWINWIRDQQTQLSPAQARHMQRRNLKLNCALRLVRSFKEGDDVWNLSYNEQKSHFITQYLKLKPLIDFFQ